MTFHMGRDEVRAQTHYLLKFLETGLYYGEV